jgi:hypothetical protein
LFFSIGGRKVIDKKPLIGVSILAVVLLVLGSLSNVVGYQSVQTSQQNLIKERINQRELLFQTIVDIANNKDIQRIILKSQMSRGIFPTSEFPVVTKNQIKMMYFIGLILLKVVSKSKILSTIGRYQFNNPEMQKKISSGIEKDATLNADVTQLQESKCDCENDSSTDYPILCGILTILFYVLAAIVLPFKLTVELLNDLFSGTLLKPLASFLTLIILPIWLFFALPLSAIIILIFEFSCWDIAPFSSII